MSIYFPEPVSPARQMELLRQLWAQQAARCDKPSVAWLVLSDDGALVSWALSKRAAEKTAQRRPETCHLARLDPRDY